METDQPSPDPGRRNAAGEILGLPPRGTQECDSGLLHLGKAPSQKHDEADGPPGTVEQAALDRGRSDEPAPRAAEAARAAVYSRSERGPSN